MAKAERSATSPGLADLWRRSLYYLRPYRLQGALVLLALSIDVAFSLTFNYYVKVLIDDAVSHRSESSLVPIFAGLAVFFVVTTLAGVSRDYISASVEAKLGNDLRLRLLRHLQGLSVDFFGRAQMGDLLARFTTDVTTVKVALTKAFPTGVYRLIQVVACLVFLFALDWRLSILTLLVLPVSLVVPRLFVSRTITANYRQAQGDASVVAHVQEQLAGHGVVRAFGLEGVMAADLTRRLVDLARIAIPASRLGRLIRTSSGMGITFATFAVTTAGVLLVFQHALSVGSLVGFIGALNLLGQACFRLMEVLPEWLAASSGIRRVEEILDEQPHIVDGPAAVVLPGLSHEIRLSHLSFGYGGDGHVLQDATAVIRAGQSVALVGHSGSGKSSVLYL